LRLLFVADELTELDVVCIDESRFVVVKDFFGCLFDPEAQAYPSSVSSFPESSASPFY
jgi:hypothetical protein